MAPFFKALSERLQDVTFRSLTQERSRAQAVKLANFLLTRISIEQEATYERYRELAERKGLPLMACQKGCSWCCYQSVATTVPEALAAADWVLGHFSPEERTALLDRIREHKAARALWKSERSGREFNEPCAFLVEGACSIHPVRPAACRGYNSSDADACRRNYEEPGTVFPRQSWEIYWRIAFDMRVGMEHGLRALGLDGGDYEFVAVMGMLLEDPELAEGCLAGERAFAEFELTEEN